MTDSEIYGKLFALKFTSPVTMGDLEALRAHVHAQPWSTKPVVDIVLRDGVVVCKLEVGGERFAAVNYTPA